MKRNKSLKCNQTLLRENDIGGDGKSLAVKPRLRGVCFHQSICFSLTDIDLCEKITSIPCCSRLSVIISRIQTSQWNFAKKLSTGIEKLSRHTTIFKTKFSIIKSIMNSFFDKYLKPDFINYYITLNFVYIFFRIEPRA